MPASDPREESSDRTFLIYPNFIPGIRLYNKKSFLDISIHQIYKNRQVQGDKQVGTKSVLVQQMYVSLGRKFILENKNEVK